MFRTLMRLLRQLLDARLLELRRRLHDRRRAELDRRDAARSDAGSARSGWPPDAARRALGRRRRCSSRLMPATASFPSSIVVGCERSMAMNSSVALPLDPLAIRRRRAAEEDEIEIFELDVGDRRRRPPARRRRRSARRRLAGRVEQRRRDRTETRARAGWS